MTWTSSNLPLLTIPFMLSVELRCTNGFESKTRVYKKHESVVGDGVIALICWLKATVRSVMAAFPTQAGLPAMQVTNVAPASTVLASFLPVSERPSVACVK